MPQKRHRFEDHGRSARRNLRQRKRCRGAGIGVNNKDVSDSDSSLKSDGSSGIKLDGCELSRLSTLHQDQSDPDDGKNSGSLSRFADQDEVDNEIPADLELEENDIADICDTDSASSDTASSDGTDGYPYNGHDSDHSDNSDSCSDSKEEEDTCVNGNVVLYPNAPVTVGESMHMILSLALDHNLTGKCLGDLLQLISLHCRQPNNCLKSLHFFQNFFKNADMPMRRHFYCSYCQTPVEADNVCSFCLKERKKEYFITFPIIPQIRAMYKREGFFEKLSYRFNRVKTHENNLEDIYDGEIYRSHCVDGGFLSDPNAISFCWNSDGVPIFKSSKYSIWPFFLRINELQYKERVRKENTILCALWFGKKEPIVNMFLLPLLPELRLLSDGIQVEIPGRPNPVQVEGMIVYGTCNMPAKCLFLNWVSYNDNFGCTACRQKGERLGDKKQVFRYLNHEPLRTDEETEQLVNLAIRFKEPAFGVKGISIMSKLVPNFVTSCAIDPMHQYLGIIKRMLIIWFSSDNHDHPASIHEHMILVDNRIRKMKVPSFIQRLRCSLKHLKHWKISEFKAFLFAYSIPCLHDLMPPFYFNHFLLLVSGLFLLNKDSISPQVLQLGSALLTEFVNQYEVWYGIENMTCNIHQLLHVGTFVKRLGPLWTASCAPFESMNESLKKYLCVSPNTDTAASLYMGVAVRRDKDLKADGPVVDFCQMPSQRQKRLRLTPISDTVSAADKLKLLNPVPANVRHVLTQANVPIGILHVCKKVVYKKRLLVGLSYTGVKETKSSCIKFKHKEEYCIGLVQDFLKVQLCDCQGLCQCPGICYALVSLYAAQNTFSTSAPRFQLPFIHECLPIDITVAVRVESVLAQCFFVTVRTIADIDKVFVVEPVNFLDFDD